MNARNLGPPSGCPNQFRILPVFIAIGSVRRLILGRRFFHRPDGEHRISGAAHHPISDAAKNPTTDAGTPVSRHDYQVARHLMGQADYGIIRLTANHSLGD